MNYHHRTRGPSSHKTTLGRSFFWTPPRASAAVATVAFAFTISGVVTVATALTTSIVGQHQGPTSTASTTTIRRQMSSNSNNNNPLTSMMSDVASSLFGGGSGGGPTSNEQLDRVIEDVAATSGGVPSWTDLSTTLSRLQNPDERNFREHVSKGRIASPLNKIRLFEDHQTEDDDIKVTFYRDSASWCPYCQKVWLTLEHKQIPYRVEKVNMRCYGDKPASFMRIQPGGQIPVAEINGRVYGQSNDILLALEEQFPNSKAKLVPEPNDIKLKARAQELFSLERQLFSVWMGWLTGRGGGRASFERTLEYVDQVLQQADGPFFLGSRMSMVDVQFSSFLERMVSSLLYFKGFVMRVSKDDPRRSTLYPGINSWFDAMEALPAYQLTKSDHYTHAHDLPPQLGGCTFEGGCETFRDAIDGVDGQSWNLPLQAHLGGLEPDWDWAAGNDEAAARREAVERLSYNHEAIVRFACRGAGRRGMPPVSAPLSDPNAVPNDAVQSSVDVCLRAVCNALLHCDRLESNSIVSDEDERAMKVLAETIESEGGKEFVQAVVDSLTYLRDRVGVPRDMRLPAARQLRAHLNWAIDRMSP